MLNRHPPRPRSFVDLLSDDGTNRVLLKWLKLWDKAVFGREVRVRNKNKKDDHEEGGKNPQQGWDSTLLLLHLQ